MRLLAAFLMAAGMVMLSSWGPEPVSASECGYDSCTTVGEGEEVCTWVSTPCDSDPEPETPTTNEPDARGGTVYTRNTCDSDGPCPEEGGGGSQTGQCHLPQGCGG